MENKSLTFKYSSLTISVNPNINKNNLYLEIPINTSSNKYSLNVSFLFDVINKIIRPSDYLKIEKKDNVTYKLTNYRNIEYELIKDQYSPKYNKRLTINNGYIISDYGDKNNVKYNGDLSSPYPIGMKINDKDAELTYTGTSRMYSLGDYTFRIDGWKGSYHEKEIRNDYVVIDNYDSTSYTIKRYNNKYNLIEDIVLKYSSNTITLKDTFSNVMYKFILNNGKVYKVIEAYKNDESIINEIVLEYFDKYTKITNKGVTKNGVVLLKDRISYIVFDSNNNEVYRKDDKNNISFSSYDISIDKIKTNGSMDLNLHKICDITSFSLGGVISSSSLNQEEITSSLFQNAKEYMVTSSSSFIRSVYTTSSLLGNEPITIIAFIKLVNSGGQTKLKVKNEYEEKTKILNKKCYGIYQPVVITLQNEKMVNSITIEIESSTTFSLGKLSIYKGCFDTEYEYDSDGLLISTRNGNAVTRNIYNEEKNLICQSVFGEIGYSYGYENNKIKTVEDSNLVSTYNYSDNDEVTIMTEGSLNNGEYLKKEYIYSNNLLENVIDENGKTTTYSYNSDKEKNAITLPDGIKTSLEQSSNQLTNKLTWSMNSTTLSSNTIICSSDYNISSMKNNDIEKYMYSYDTNNNLSELKLYGISIEKYSYDYNISKLKEIEYSNTNKETYTYDNEGRLGSVNFNGDIFTYTYDNLDRVISVSNNDASIKNEFTYKEDKLIIEKIDGLRKENLLYDNKNYVEKYDSIIHESNGNILTNTNKYYLCEFNNTYKFNCNVPEAFINRNNITYVTNGNLKEIKVNDSWLSYLLKGSTCGTVGTMFRRDTYASDGILTLGFNGDKLQALFSNDNNLLIYFRNELLFNLGKIEDHNYHLFALSWYYTGLKFIIIVQIDKKIYARDDINYLPITPLELRLFYGVRGLSINETNNSIYFSNLFVSKLGILSDEILESIYQRTASKILSIDEKRTSTIINSRIIKDDYGFDIYPLHNDLTSIKGNKPLLYEARRTSEDGIDKSFSYNELGNKTAYYAKGQLLAYNFNFDDRGTIILNASLNDDLESKQTILELVSSNNVITLYKKESNLELAYNNIVLKTISIGTLPSWAVIGLSFYDETESDNYSSTTYHCFRIYCNGRNATLRTLHSFSFNNVITYIGRGKNEINPMNGHIEMMCVKKSISEVSTLDNVLKYIIRGEQLNVRYDDFKRIEKKNISVNNSSILNHDYVYKNSRTGFTSLLVGNEKIKIKDNTHTRRYSYDNGNRVTSINDSIFGNKTYTYNNKGFITSERDNNYSFEYKYDNNGNIASIKKIKLASNYSNSSSSGFSISSRSNIVIQGGDEVVDERTLTYDTDNKDLIKSINSDTCVYSGLFPTHYRRSIFQWRCNRLIDNGSFSFKYNAEGNLVSIIRNSINSEVRHLYYSGNRLIKEIDKTTNKSIYYLYDTNGSLYGFVYDGNTYYYIRDILQNIIGIIDSNGDIVVKYDYSAYGELITISDTSNINLSTINRFRYKGYYYVEELRYYWLISRFYDPEIGRFISPDSVDYLEPSSINGLNLYSYCENDPVMYVDPSGCFPVLAVILCGIALVGMGLTIGGVASDNNTLTAVGLGMVAAAALVSGGIALAGAIATGATLTGIIGGVTATAGLGSLGFMSAEIQEATGNGNWIMDTTGMSDGLYNTLLLSTAAIATLGTAASSVSSAFNIKSINGFGKYGDYYGMKFQTGAGKTRVLSFHNHGHKVAKGIKSIGEWHWQLQKWNPMDNKTSGTIARWIWWSLTKM